MKIWLCSTIAALAASSAVYLSYLGLSFLYSYYAAPDNPLRNENLEGLALAGMLSIPFWMLASASLYPIRAVVPRPIFIGTTVIAGLVLISFLAANVHALLLVQLGR